MIYILIAISGILTALSTMYKWSGFLAFFSLVPYLYIVFQRSSSVKKRKCLLYGIAFSTPFFLTIYHWFWYLYPMEFLDFSKPAAFFTCLFFQVGLSALQSAVYFLMPLVFKLCIKHIKRLFYPLIFALIWSVCEYLHTLTWTGVPWARLALSQTEFKPLLSLSSLFGSVFVAFVIVAVNGYLSLAIIEIISHKKAVTNGRALIFSSLALAVFVFSTGAGMIISARSQRASLNGNALNYVIVQTNIGSNEKWSLSEASSIKKACDMSMAAVSNFDADIIIWPETTSVSALNENSSSARMISKLSEETEAVVIAGGFTYRENEKGDYFEYNSLVAFYPNGENEEIGYSKRHLVPFGEYVPMRKFLTSVFPFLDDINILGSDLTPGNDSEILSLEQGNIGRLICFDSIYPALALDSVRDGAEILVLSTNDSWYKDSASAYQHNKHAVLRAVESERWVLRCATTGISCAITPSGEITDSIGALNEGVITGTAYMNNSRTLYSHIGDTLVYFAIILLISLGAYGIYKNNKKQ